MDTGEAAMDSYGIAPDLKPDHGPAPACILLVRSLQGSAQRPDHWRRQAQCLCRS